MNKEITKRALVALIRESERNLRLAMTNNNNEIKDIDKYIATLTLRRDQLEEAKAEYENTKGE